ncbi:MAG: response regulator [Limisphaerales bacterium]
MARILIADDEEDVRTLLRRALTIAGHEVQVAKDGNEALAILRTATVDVAVVDLYMPGKDGIETILDVRRRYADIKIIAITGSAPKTGPPVLAMAQKLGAHLTLAKPFSVEELMTALKQVHPQPPA